MIDSCRPRKDEPGLAATYSKPSDLITSTMKSEPGRSVVYTSTRGGGGLVSAATPFAEGRGVTDRVWPFCGSAREGVATSAAVPRAAPFKKPRRSREVFLKCGTDQSPSRLSASSETYPLKQDRRSLNAKRRSPQGSNQSVFCSIGPGRIIRGCTNGGCTIGACASSGKSDPSVTGGGAIRRHTVHRWQRQSARNDPLRTASGRTWDRGRQSRRRGCGRPPASAESRGR